jgi:hypothetical protein
VRAARRISFRLAHRLAGANPAGSLPRNSRTRRLLS